MQAGKLREFVALQSKAVTRDAIGAEVVTWTTDATLPAEVVYLRGREFFAAAQMQSQVDVRIVLRYRDGVTTDHRILWNGQPYDIRAVLPSARRNSLELMCSAGVHDGR